MGLPASDDPVPVPLRTPAPIRITISTPQGTRSLDYDGGSPLRIGRDPAATVVLDDKNASRSHCEVQPLADGKFELVDLGSRNGTILNGSRVDRSPIRPGDAITVGSVQIFFGSSLTVEGPAGRSPPALQTESTPPVASEELPPASTEQSPPGPRLRRRIRRPSRRGFRHPVLTWLLIAAVGAGTFVAVLQHLHDPIAEREAGSAADQLVATRTEPAMPAPGAAGAAATSEQGATAVEPAKPAQAADLVSHKLGDDVATGPSNAEEDWSRLRRERSGSELLAGYRDFVARHPDSPHAQEARVVLDAVEALDSRGGKGFVASILGTAQDLCREERLGEARALLGAGALLARAEGSEETAAILEEETARVDRLTEEQVLRKQKDAQAALTEGRNAEAFRSLMELAPRVGSTPAFVQALLEFENAFYAADLSRRLPASSRTLEQVDRARAAIGACRFREAQGAYLLALSADPEMAAEDKALYWRKAEEAGLMARMFESAIALLGESRPEVDIYATEKVRASVATTETIEYEVFVEGGASAKVTCRWDQLRDPIKLRFFSAVGLAGEGLLGLATYAWEVGDEAAAEAALLRLLRYGDRWKAQIQALIALRLETPVPEGGFVEYEGHFVDPAERDRRETEKRRAKEGAEAAKRELAEARRGRRVEAYLAIAQELRAGGHFEAADGLYRAIAQRFAKEPGGREASRRLDDAVLLVTRIAEGTPRPANRLTFFFLGDGYLTLDEQQVALSASARRLWNLLLKDEPYREYQSYFDAHVVNVASRESGSDRMPGNVKHDTAFGGSVEWDTYKVDHAAVARVLDGIAPSTHRQAVVVGNAAAATATGGNSLVSIPKTCLGAVPHEVGHALGGLHDEYDLPAGNDPKRKIVKGREGTVPVRPMPPNLIAGSLRDEVLRAAPWRRWIEASQERGWSRGRVDIFEGGAYSPVEVWRPQGNCMMRYGGMFCVVCMEAMVKAIYRNVRPIDAVRPNRERFEHPPGAPLLLEVEVMKPRTHFLEVKWGLQYFPLNKAREPDAEQKAPAAPPPPGRGTTRVVPTAPEVTAPVPHSVKGKEYHLIAPGGVVVEVFQAPGSEMRAPGTYVFTVEVHDPTPWVIEDDEGLLRQKWTWTVTVADPAASRSRPATGAGR